MQLLRATQAAVPAAVMAIACLAGGPVRVPEIQASAWSPPACATTPGAARDPGAAPGAWYRLEPVLDGSGTLAGRHLTAGASGHRAVHLDLTAESSASGPRDGLVLVVDDDGRRSRLRLLDPARACAMEAGGSAEVVRSAIAAPGGRTAWEHRVDRRTRADLGIWQRDLTTGTATRVLPGIPADVRYGPTFVTDLTVGADGRLGVSSCGLQACRTRVFDAGTGGIEQFEGTGALIGVSGGRAVAWAACPGLPCPVLAVDLASGARGVLAQAAGLAALGDPTDSSLVYEAPGGGIRVAEVASGRTRAAGTRAGLPIRASSLADGGAETVMGEVPLAPGGRVTGGAAVRVMDPVTQAVSGLGTVLP